ncbi:hypothetical protein AVEN_9108-1 [Araneus ventricosus]|uniref:Uncharacterized protein n=1 Tax=Araneus ventricosus TaxID=182803 RepID=A0A4Y2PBD5_ARAVE|nr:hypothetical protein AVEN_9108-1 [Araneus ventricosus]
MAASGRSRAGGCDVTCIRSIVVTTQILLERLMKGPRWPSDKVSTSVPEGSKPVSTEDPTCVCVWGGVTGARYIRSSGSKVLPLVRCGSVERGGANSGVVVVI